MTNSEANTTYVIDTNALLNNPNIIKGKDVVLLPEVAMELRKLERKKQDRDLQYSVRKAKQAIMQARKTHQFHVEFRHSDLETEVVDEKILGYAWRNSCAIITDDVQLIIEADILNVKTISAFSTKEVIKKTGLIDFVYDPTDEEQQEKLANIYGMLASHPNAYYNPFDMKENEYLVIWDKETAEEIHGKTYYKEKDTFRFNGTSLQKIKYKDLSGQNNLEPRNVKQRCVFDLLQDRNIPVKLVSGIAGSGKDMTMLTHAIEYLKGKDEDRNVFDKIIWVRNNVEVKDTNSIGFLPNSLEEKLEPFLAPLLDKAGGKDGYEYIKDRVEIVHLGFMRGRQFDKSLIYVTECQANTEAHVKMLLERVGEGSEIWFNGDTKQTDSRLFELDNGVDALKKLTGQPLFGHVELDKVERSKTARLGMLLGEE